MFMWLIRVPGIYATVANQNKTSPDFFAELFAYTDAGDPDFVNNQGGSINGSDQGFLVGFVCTAQYMQTMIGYGRLPTSAEISANGYFVPDSGNPSTPGYTTYSCDGTVGQHYNYDFGN